MTISDASPKLKRLRQLVADARGQLAELETDFITKKSGMDAVQAGLFRRLREHHQKRDRLLLVIEHRQNFLDSFIRDSPEEVEQAEKDFEQARAQLEEDYEELAAAADKKKKLTTEEEAELTRLWKKLVKLCHPGRFASEPEKLETYQKLTAAINLAKDNGDIELLREIAEDPIGFLLRKGWADLDFGDPGDFTQLERLHEALQKEISEAVESLKELRASPDYELCQLAEQKPGTLEELAAERIKRLELENAELGRQAEKLALKIKNVSGVG